MMRLGPSSRRTSPLVPEGCRKSYLLLQRAKPAQSNGSLRVIDFMAAMERSDFKSVETSTLDQTQNSVLLLWRRHPIIVPSTKINWRSEKIRARLAPRVSVAEVVFIDTG